MDYTIKLKSQREQTYKAKDVKRIQFDTDTSSVIITQENGRTGFFTDVLYCIPDLNEE